MVCLAANAAGALSLRHRWQCGNNLTTRPLNRQSIMATATAAIGERQWFIVGRWQEFEGEDRANLLRTIAIGAFYIIELLQFYVFAKADPAQLPLHRHATSIAVAWTMVALAVLLCLRLRIFPAALKYASTGADVILLTSLAALAGGPSSSLVFAYFLIIALAALRFSLGLVWFATIASMLGYWLLVGLKDPQWFDADHAVPPATQLITLLSLALTGIIIGQVVRRVKGMAGEYAQRLAAAEKAA